VDTTKKVVFKGCEAMETVARGLPQDAWLEDFQRVYLDGIDTELIGTIVQSLRWAEGTI